MPIGQSGGRSAGNRQTGDRRATQRERQHIDPPGHSDWVRMDEEEAIREQARKHDRWAEFVAMQIWIVASVVIGLLICKWWGLL